MHKRMLYVLQKSVELLFGDFGINRIGFLTCTFKEDVTAQEAMNRFHSLCSHVLKPRYGKFIRVYARTKKGRPHFHILVTTKADIRTGCDFKAMATKDYRSAPSALKAEWSFWRANAHKYGFGRCEFMPAKGDAETIANYLKGNPSGRTPADKGVRLVAYSPGTRFSVLAFSKTTPEARAWRTQVGLFASIIDCPQEEPLAVFAGRHWAFTFRPLIDHLTFQNVPDFQRILGRPPRKCVSRQRRKNFIEKLKVLQSAVRNRCEVCRARKRIRSANGHPFRTTVSITEVPPEHL